MASLTTLEYTALGIILKKRRCKAYGVMVEFTHSRAEAYRTGAGTVYPLLDRLEAAGLIHTEAEDGHKLYSITDEGANSLRSWFDPAEVAQASCCLDVIRSRAYFMKVLSESERAAFLQSALSGLQELLSDCRKKVAAYRKAGDPFSEAAMEGTVFETQARIKWVKRLQALDFGAS